MGIWESDADTVIKAMKLWDPAVCKRERDFESSLYGFLNKALPKEVFHRQWSFAKTTADIYVELKEGTKVAIEVKAGLEGRNEFHRLLGQAWVYALEWNVDVVIVLCGKSDPALAKSAARYADWLDEKVRGMQKIRFIHVATEMDSVSADV